MNAQTHTPSVDDMYIAAQWALAITVIVIVLAAWFGDVALTGSGW